MLLCLAILVGLQSSQFAVFAKEFGISEGLLPRSDSSSVPHLQRALGVGLFALLSGASLLAIAVWLWGRADFGNLDYAKTMRIVIPGGTGHLGRILAPAFRDKGHEVAVLSTSCHNSVATCSRDAQVLAIALAASLRGYTASKTAT